MEKLPLDILALIATKLPCEALLRCALVSKAWHRTFTQPVLFRRLAIALGAPRNAAADDSKKWRRIWWHARQVVVWPGKRQLTDRDVTEWVSYRASKGGPLEIALMDPFEGQKMATAAALRELCVSLTGSIDALYEIPPTPQGMCAGMPPGHCRVDLPRLRVPIVLFRSRMNFDSGC